MNSTAFAQRSYSEYGNIQFQGFDSTENSASAEKTVSSNYLSSLGLAFAGVAAAVGSNWVTDDSLSRPYLENTAVYSEYRGLSYPVAANHSRANGIASFEFSQLSSFFNAMPHADKYAVIAIIDSVRKYFSDALKELHVEHYYDEDVDRHRLLVSVDTGLGVQEILNRRKIFDRIILSDDAKKAASKYTITTFF